VVTWPLATQSTLRESARSNGCRVLGSHPPVLLLRPVPGLRGLDTREPPYEQMLVGVEPSHPFFSLCSRHRYPSLLSPSPHGRVWSPSLVLRLPVVHVHPLAAVVMSLVSLEVARGHRGAVVPGNGGGLSAPDGGCTRLGCVPSGYPAAQAFRRLQASPLLAGGRSSGEAAVRTAFEVGAG
jgi:hypothetical protein